MLHSLLVRTYLSVTGAVTGAFAALGALVAVRHPVPAVAGRRRGATILEYMLLAAFGVFVAALLWRFLRTPIENIVERISGGLTQGDTR